ncbi:MAG: hypothetical protein MUC28_04345 [Planctomycetes bacterium]|jgi:hypothetical protein|nr:hypothetical protein [Planctomycetota bacterium]
MPRIGKLIFSAAIIMALLSGCGAQTPSMDQPAADGSYYYQNPDLGFALTLPPDFEYYQAQRTARANHTELALFVPTGDTSYPQDIPGYAQPVTVRIFPRTEWEKTASEEDYKDSNRFVRENKGRVYVLVFWDERPADWQVKWSDDMKQKISDSFIFL